MSDARRLDLRAIDDRLVPEAARRLQALLGWAGRTGGRTAAGARTAVHALRTRPLVSGALLVLAVAAAVAAVQVGNRGGGTGQSQTPAVPAVGYTYSTVGPTPGELVSRYLQQAHARLAQLARRPGASAAAIVDLSGYRTPAEAVALFAGVQVSQVSYRVRVPGLTTRPHVAAVSGTGQVPQVIARSGQVEASTADSLLRYAQTLPATSTVLRQQRALLLQQAQVARAESVQLTGTCRCVFAVVVQAPATRLQALAGRPGVRVVDPAPAGSQPGDVGFLPLAPEVTTTVPSNGDGAP